MADDLKAPAAQTAAWQGWLAVFVALGLLNSVSDLLAHALGRPRPGPLVHAPVALLLVGAAVLWLRRRTGDPWGRAARLAAAAGAIVAAGYVGLKLLAA